MVSRTLHSTTKVAKISSKGQITLPKKLLVSLNLKYGDSITISFDRTKAELFNQKQAVKNKISKLLNTVVPKIGTNLSLEEQIEAAKKDHFNQSTI